MTQKAGVLVFNQARRRKLRPGEVVAVMFVPLPDSNGQVRLCIFRHYYYNQLVAGLQHRSAPILESLNPEITRGELRVPDRVIRYIRHQLRTFRIQHIQGIVADNSTEEGRVLSVH